MNFFVAAVGRGGTNWLHRVLAQAPGYTVLHEDADPKCFGNSRDMVLARRLQPFEPFPIQRFLRPNYGEVHGFLRYSLSPHIVGLERMVPRRAVLTRDIRKQMTSWLNNLDRHRDESAAIIHEVLTRRQFLDEWAASDPGSRVISLEEVGSDLEALQSFVDWLEIGLELTENDLAPANVTPNEKRGAWDDELEDLAQRIAAHQGCEYLLDPAEENKK